MQVTISGPNDKATELKIVAHNIMMVVNFNNSSYHCGASDQLLQILTSLCRNESQMRMNQVGNDRPLQYQSGQYSHGQV